MAEFCEVMRQWNRRLAAEHMLIDGNITGMDALWLAIDHPERVESLVMSWAAEHPEPVYPTWGEYLQEQGILDVEYIPAASSTTSTSKMHVQTVKTLAPFYRPIPADTAEKLGIEPKEGRTWTRRREL